MACRVDVVWESCSVGLGDDVFVLYLSQRVCIGFNLQSYFKSYLTKLVVYGAESPLVQPCSSKTGFTWITSSESFSLTWVILGITSSFGGLKTLKLINRIIAVL